jgi:hypothetical protein
VEKYEIGLSPNLFARAFPFHFIADVSLRVIQVGPSMAKIIGANCIGTKVSDLFAMLKPVDVELKSMRKVRLRFLFFFSPDGLGVHVAVL